MVGIGHAFSAFARLHNLYGGCFYSYLSIAIENEVLNTTQTWVGKLGIFQR